MGPLRCIYNQQDFQLSKGWGRERIHFYFLPELYLFFSTASISLVSPSKAIVTCGLSDYSLWGYNGCREVYYSILPSAFAFKSEEILFSKNQNFFQSFYLVKSLLLVTLVFTVFLWEYWTVSLPGLDLALLWPVKWETSYRPALSKKP